jgi:DNA mismatch repair protein MutS
MQHFINKELVNFFNNTNNIHSEGFLVNILRTQLKNKTEVLERQALIQSIIQKKLHTNFYATYDLYEAYEFTKGFTAQFEMLVNEKIKFHILIKAKKAFRYQLYSKLKLLCSTIGNINKYVFANMDVSALPPYLKRTLGEVYEFLGRTKILDVYERKFLDDTVSHHEVYDLLYTCLTNEADNNFLKMWQLFFELEAYISIAQTTVKHQFVFPTITNDNVLKIESFYHPMVPHCVSNTLHTYKHCMVLTGPNMSGKSVLLKTIGMCIWFAHIGLAIPATAATIPFYNTIIIHLTQAENIEKGYSQFFNEIKHIKEVVEAINTQQNCFCLFDEMYSGTNIQDASVLFNKTINTLQHTPNVTAIISTHLHIEQQAIASKYKEVHFIYLDVHIKNKQPLFTYKLAEGISEVKLGQTLFELEGLHQFFK